MPACLRTGRPIGTRISASGRSGPGGRCSTEVRAYAAGLSRLGLERGDTIAIVGSNRPRLYWSLMAAQMLGAVPVPVYADAVADELAYVLAHSDVRFAAVEDQEQVDKILSVSERLPKLAQVVYDEPRGLRDYDHSRLHAIDDVIKDGREALAKDPALGAEARPRDRSRAGLGPFDHSLYVGHHRAVEGRRAVRHRLHQCGIRHGGVRRAHRARRGARLSAARLGRGPLPQLCAGAGRGLLPRLSGERRHRDGGHEGDRPDLLLRSAAGVRADAHPRHDPHGGCEPDQAARVPRLPRRRAAPWREDPQRRARAAHRPPALRARRTADLRAAQERARSLARAHRLYRGRGDRARPVFVLPLDRAEPQAALRPDRSLPLSHRAARRENLFRHRRCGHDQRRSAHRRERRGAVQVAGPCSWAISRTRPRPPRR